MIHHPSFVRSLLLAVVLVPNITSNAKRVMVTGGAGFVGSHVADFLLSRGDEVVVVDEVNSYYDTNIKEGNLRMLQEKYITSVSIYRGDLCDTDFMNDVFASQSAPFDAICHMAARAGVRPSIQDPFLYVHSNIQGTVTLMDYAVRHKIQNFVFASSSSVYGGSKSTFFSELEQVDNPISPYAATKKSCELFSYVYQHHYDLNVTALRFFTVYGPRGRPDMAPFKFIDNVSRGRALQQFGDGTSSRDYTYISDIVNGVVKAVDTPVPYTVLNLGKGSGTKLKEFLELVETYVGRKAKIELLPDQPGDVPYTCANVTLAHNHLGYEAIVPFEEGIQRTVQWYKEVYPIESEEAVSENRSTLRRYLNVISDSPPDVFDDSEVHWMSLYDVDEMMLLPRRKLSLLGDRKGNSNSPDWKSSKIEPPHTEHKKVLVTGGAGFIGSHVVEYLLNRGDDVVVVDTNEFTTSPLAEERQATGQLIMYKGDVTDSHFMGQVFVDEKPEWIVHLASRANVKDSLVHPVDYIHSNVEATLRLLELSRGTKHGGTHNLRNFVFASSSSVYGSERSRKDFSLDSIVRSEDERVDFPKTPYASSKKTSELLAYTYHHLYKIPVSILRLFEVYGPRSRPDSASFRLVDHLLLGRHTADNSRSDNDFNGDYVFIKDVVRGIVQALDRPYGYEIFNIGSGRFNEKEFVQAAGQFVGMTAEEVTRYAFPSQSVDGIAYADIQKAARLIDFRPIVSLDEGIRLTMTWHQQTHYPDMDRLVVRDGSTENQERNKSSNSSSDPTGLLPTTNLEQPYLKVKKVQEEKLTVSSWLQNFTLIQWVLVVSVLMVRAVMYTPLWACCRGTLMNFCNEQSRSPSPTFST